MRLIMNGINGKYLRDITDSHANQTEEVIVAVAYATQSSLLFDWCWQHDIPLKFYGRLDDQIAVNIPILSKFLSRRSPNYSCRLIQNHHAKVIWWRGVGVYIGSANLTDSAWHTNVEAGCFFLEEEISNDMASDILNLFDTLEKHSTPLTEELFKEIQKRAKILNNFWVKDLEHSKAFWESPSIMKWQGLVKTTVKSVAARKRDVFLKEWHSTLQEIRNIGIKISQPENRPTWINTLAPAGVQADQFLHAHYYQRTFDGRKANYMAFFEKNKGRRDEALSQAIKWWKQLPKAPSSEDEMINITAPFLQNTFAEYNLKTMTYEQFRDACMKVHAIKDYARRVRNKAVGLPDDGTQYTIPEKVAALSKRIWNDRSASNYHVTEVITYVLYGGSNEQLPERLWQAIDDPKWKIDGLGISAYGELVGWALPDRFPPRNGRTSKSLKSLGYNVTIHVE